MLCRISAAVQILYFPTKHLCVQTAAVQLQGNIRCNLREAWEDAGFSATCVIFKNLHANINKGNINYKEKRGGCKDKKTIDKEMIGGL